MAARDSSRVFAALGDPTRLRLLAKLGEGNGSSIASLTAGSKLTRQAITKHLGVLRKAGLIRGRRRGRERLFALQPAALDRARRSLDDISRQWDEALVRLKALAER